VDHEAPLIADSGAGGVPAGGAISYQGYLMAHEQIKLNGNPRINGAILAEDASNLSDFVNANAISGNANITFDCTAGPPIPGPVRFIAWGF
jgi:hypothetical protein